MNSRAVDSVEIIQMSPDPATFSTGTLAKSGIKIIVGPSSEPSLYNSEQGIDCRTFTSLFHTATM
jgi:hypothetical protein